jgi:sterol desaturase/sphingolipid hydroxylase (fatty acid hydroxylase superfamily)
MTLLKLFAVLVAGYYVTTLAIWAGHWFSHQYYSPPREFHVGGHHALYPHSASSLSARFLYGTGRNDSLFALLPPLLVLGALIAVCTSGWIRWTLLAEAGAVSAASSWMHAQFHIGPTVLRRYRWFQKARQQHWLHHDQDVNFMVADLFWDRVFGTYGPATERSSS